MAGAAQVPIYKDGHNLLTVGLDPFAIGVSANYTYTNGNNSVNVSAGIGALSGPYANVGASHNMGDWNLSAGAGVGKNYWGWNTSVTVNGGGLGYGQTYYGNAIGPDRQSNAQRVASASILWNGGSFTLQNDLKKLGGDGDRWRTNAWELTIGDFSVGSYLYTNDGEADSQKYADLEHTGSPVDATCLSPIFRKNRGNYSTWLAGETFSAPIWLGYRVGNQISRIGYSFPASQDLQQNFIHKYLGRQHFYTGYNNFKTGFYLNSGYYNPFSLWGY